MADKKARSTAQLERELAALKKQMKASGLKVPKTILGTHKYSGKEEEFKGKEFGFKTGCIRSRIAASNFDITATEKAELFNSKGLLLSEKAIKNAKVMNVLIERKAGILEEITKESKEEK